MIVQCITISCNDGCGIINRTCRKDLTKDCCVSTHFTIETFHGFKFSGARQLLAGAQLFF